MRHNDPALPTLALLALGCVACSGDLYPLVAAGDTGPDTRLVADAQPAVDTRVRAGECSTSQDCVEGQGCSTTGGCVAVRCGLPSTGGGSLALGQSCVGRPCRAGLVCAEVAAGPGAAPQDTHRCSVPCDPCRPSCPESLSCLQLEGLAGGFCALSLRAEGQRCDSEALRCQAGLVCHCLTSSCNCRRPCTPSEGQDLIAFGSAASSDDCDEPAVHCTVVTQSAAGDQHQCAPGVLIETGQLCGRATLDHDREGFCRYPDVCSVLVREPPLAAVCTPPNCEGGCPDDAPCTGGKHCIRDGVLPNSAHCVETRTCQAGLVCIPTPGEPEGQLRCQPPAL